jgi:DNA-binding response OmpR family regulator
VQQLSFMRGFLDSLGFDVSALPNGETAVVLCANRSFDLAILDISLPGISGWETAVQLRERAGQKMSIVMLSANAQEFHKPEAQTIVHDLFLVKPIEFNALLEALGGLLNLSWKWDDRAAPAAPVPARAQVAASSLPEVSRPHVERLRDLLRIGHVRAIEAEIAALDESSPQVRALVEQLYSCLDRFDLSGMARKLEDV